MQQVGHSSNSEFGGNRYLCQAYLAGPDNPFLEKIHAWNLSCRWAEFMEHGTAGGSIYRLDDLDAPRDQDARALASSPTTTEHTQLACWEVGHMWRDFEIEVKEVARGELQARLLGPRLPANHHAD